MTLLTDNINPSIFHNGTLPDHRGNFIKSLLVAECLGEHKIGLRKSGHYMLDCPMALVLSITERL